MKKGVVIGVALIFSFVLAAVFVIPSVSAGGGCGGLQDPLTEEGLCADEIDNDCDNGNGIDDEDPNTGIDCDDTDCYSDPACIPTPTIGTSPSYPGTGVTDISGGGPGPVKPGPPEPGPDPSPSSEEASGLFGGFFKNLFEKIFGNKDKVDTEDDADGDDDVTDPFPTGVEGDGTDEGDGSSDSEEADYNDDGNVNIGDAIYPTGVEGDAGGGQGHCCPDMCSREGCLGAPCCGGVEESMEGDFIKDYFIFVPTGVEGDGTGEGYEDLYKETLMDINEWTAEKAKAALWENSDEPTERTALFYSNDPYGRGMAEAFKESMNGYNVCSESEMPTDVPGEDCNENNIFDNCEIAGGAADIKELDCDSAVVFGPTNFLESVVEGIENQGLNYLPMVLAAPVEMDKNGDYSFVDGGDIGRYSGSWIKYLDDPSMFLPVLAKAKASKTKMLPDDPDDDGESSAEGGCEEGSVCETPNPECSGTCRGGVCHERCPVDEIQAAVNGEGIDSDLTVIYEVKGPKTKINDPNGDKIGTVTNMKVIPGGEKIDFTYESSDGSEEAFYGAKIGVPLVVGNQKIIPTAANPGNGLFKRDSASFGITEIPDVDFNLMWHGVDGTPSEGYGPSEITVTFSVDDETLVAGRIFTLEGIIGVKIDLGVDGFGLPLLEEGKIYEIPVYGEFNNPITLTVVEITNEAVTITFEVGKPEERSLSDLVSREEFSRLPDSEKIDVLWNMIRSLQNSLQMVQSKLPGGSGTYEKSAGISGGLTPTSGSGDMQKTANCQAGEYYPIDLDPQSGVIGLLHDDSLGDDYINAEGYCKVVNGCDSYLVGTVNKDGTQSCDCDENGCPATAGCEFTSSTSGYSRIWSLYCYDYAPVGCTDSDINNKYPKGDNYETKGNALDGSNTYEDECVGNTLYEGECAVDWDLASYWAVSVPYDCPNGCFNGACLPTKSPSDQEA